MCVSDFTATTLQELAVKLISNDDCKSYDFYRNLHEPSMMCAVSADRESNGCHGDSGGPLQCVSRNGIWKLIGLVSYGPPECPGNMPGGYTRVASLVNWINKFITGMYESHSTQGRSVSVCLSVHPCACLSHS